MKWHSPPALKLYSPFQINRLKALLGICHFPSYHEQRRLKKNGKQRISYMEISLFSPVKLAISVWLWRRRLLLFVFLASLKSFGFKLSLGICILSQGGLWVTVSAIVAWPGCLAVLRACLASTPYALCSKGFGELVCHLIYLPFYILVDRVNNHYILRTSMYRKWVFYQRKFGLFDGALEPLFKICGRFVGSLCMLVVEALRCFVFLCFKEITLFNEILLSWQICFSERLPRCC